VPIFGNVVEIAAERMEELAGGASLRDAGSRNRKPPSCLPYSGKLVEAFLCK
jgi:hypothetical protein